MPYQGMSVDGHLVLLCKADQPVCTVEMVRARLVGQAYILHGIGTGHAVKVGTDQICFPVKVSSFESSSDFKIGCIFFF